MPDISDLATSDVVGFTGRGGIASVADGEITVQNDAGTNAFTIDVNGSAELQVVDNEIGVPAGDSLSVYNVGGPGDTNYERLRAYWSSNTAWIDTSAGGTGSTRNMLIRGAAVYIGTTGSTKLSITSTQISAGVDVVQTPSASITPTSNGNLCIEATSNTELTFKYKGSDGTVRSNTLTLS